MIKVELVKYFRFMRNHGAESEDWTVRWPFSPAEIDLSILTALWILQPVTTWKSILRLFVFSRLSDKWLEPSPWSLPPGALFLFSWSPILLEPLRWPHWSVLLWGEASAGYCVCVTAKHPHFHHFNEALWCVCVCSEALCLLDFVCLGGCSADHSAGLRFSLRISLFCSHNGASIMAVLDLSPVSNWSTNTIASGETSRFQVEAHVVPLRSGLLNKWCLGSS